MKLLTDREAADYLGITVRQLSERRRDRCQESERIPFVPISPRCIRYRESDLDAWIEARVENKITPRKLTAVKHG